MRCAGDEVVDGGVGDQPATADDDQTCCGLRHFAHQVGGHEHGVPVGGQVFEHGADPSDPFGVQAVDRFVQDHGLRVAQQRGGNAESLAHAEGESAGAFAGNLLESDDVDHLLDPASPDAVGVRQGEEVVAGRSAGVHCFGFQQHPELGHRGCCGPVVAAVDGDPAGGGPVESGDHPHGGGLSGSVRAEKPGDDPGLHDEVQSIDGEFVAVPLAEILDFDHRGTFRNMWARRNDRSCCGLRLKAGPDPGTAIGSRASVIVVMAELSGFCRSAPRWPGIGRCTSGGSPGGRGPSRVSVGGLRGCCKVRR